MSMAKTNNRYLWLVAWIALCIYLVISAPPPLVQPVQAGKKIPIEFALELLNALLSYFF